MSCEGRYALTAEVLLPGCESPEAPRDWYRWVNAEIPQNSHALRGLSLSPFGSETCPDCPLVWDKSCDSQLNDSDREHQPSVAIVYFMDKHEQGRFFCTALSTANIQYFG